MGLSQYAILADFFLVLVEVDSKLIDIVCLELVIKVRHHVVLFGVRRNRLLVLLLIFLMQLQGKQMVVLANSLLFGFRP